MARSIVRMLLCSLCLAMGSAHAAPLFSQTPVSNLAAYGSDLTADTNGRRSADDFALSGDAIARSVTWRGVFEATPSSPVTFSLALYTDAAGTPGSVISAASATFAATSLVDTGIDLLGVDVYEFRANLTPTLLTAGATYWFSPLAMTAADTDDDWFWLSSTSHDIAAFQSDVTGSGPWVKSAYGPNYFVISSTSIPEPAAVSLMLAGCGLLLRRRPDNSA